MITPEQYETITLKAREIAVSWPDVPAADIAQHLALLWCESWARHDGKRVTIRTYVEDEDVERGAKRLNKTLTRWATTFCRRETAAIRGHDDYSPYSREAVKEMLPLLHDLESWSSLAVSGARGRSGKLSSEGGDALAVHADLTRAFDMLSPSDKQLVVWRYVDCEPDWHARAMELLDQKDTAARKAVSRALTRLLRGLAGPPLEAGQVRRRAFSNAKALSVTRGDY